MHTPKHTRARPWRPWLWGSAALLLALPWIAMRFTAEVAWDRADFLVFGAMLVLACGAYELCAHLTTRRRWRVVAAAVISASFLLVWAELAVGIFD
ncbi:MAG: hypothetical protein KA196_09360 [Arenimonas sp.]|nr:hypothetical protein [Arenimonas sp.]